MTSVLPRRFRFRHACVVVLLAAAWSVAAVPARATPAQAQAEPPQAETASPEEPAEEPILDKPRLLKELYQRLGESPDAESAEVVAEAIQRLWLRSGSDTVDLLMRRAMQMVQKEKLDVSLEILDSVVVIEPSYTEGWNQRATVNFLRRDYRSSLEDLRQVLSLDPSHFKAINGLALILQELGDKSAALRAYRRALGVHPHLEGARQAIRELSREVEGQGI